MKQYLAIDIGGTSVKLGLVDETGGILAKAEESVSFDGWQTPILTTVLAAAERFLTARGKDPQALEGIGVSATGQINSHTGVVAGTCYTDVIGVTLGTGVGGGILTGGRLLEGARGLGGEMGHYRTHAQHGLLCTCGAVGCWEQYASTTALVRGAHAIDPDLKDGRAIFAAAEAGNPLVLDLIDRWTDEIAQGLAGMVHIFNPQLILIGGGVSAQEKFLIEPVAAKVRRSIMPAFAEGLEIRAAQLHNDAGMVGAVYYFRQTMENT